MFPLFPVQGVPYCYVVILFDKSTEHMFPPVFFILEDAANKYLNILKRQKHVVVKIFTIPASPTDL